MKKRRYTDKNMPVEKKDKLENLKKKVQMSLDHDSENYRYFNFMKSFICDTTLDAETRNKLAAMKKPQLECNEVEQFVNTLLGEFKNYEPSIEVRPASTITDPAYAAKQQKTAELIEGYIRYKFSNRETDGSSFEIFADLLRGGLSSATLEIDWKHDDPYEFDVDLFFKKEPYPTMCGWDVMAVKSHRGDGRYCFRIFAYTKEMAIEKYGKDAVEKISPQYGIEGFSWSYYQNDEAYYIFCEFFEEERKKIKTVLLSDGSKMSMKDYKVLLDSWDDISVPPIPVQEKMGEEIRIWQYIFNENKIMECNETDYKYLPIVRFQGGSVKLEDNMGSNKRELCRSYVHNLVGVQMLKNTAAQGVAFEIENTMAHKMLMELETVIPTQMDALINNQIPNVILWQSRPRRGDSESESYPMPQVIARPPVPQIIQDTFYQTSVSMRRMMGVMETNAAPNGNIAGDTLRSAYTQESRASCPWRQGFEDGLNRFGTMYMDLIPKIFKTPTSIPIISRDGQRSYKSINDPMDPESIMMDFDPKEFNIEIRAGVNAEVLRHVGMTQLMELSRTFKGFNEFIDQECKPELIENIDIKNKGALVMKAQDWQKKQEAMMQQRAQDKPIDPIKATLQIEGAKIQQKNQEIQIAAAQKDKEMQLNAAVQSAKIQQDNRKVDMELMKTMSTVKGDHLEAEARKQKAQSENIRSAALLATQLAKGKSESRRFHHQLNASKMKHQEKSMAHESMEALGINEEPSGDAAEE